MDQLVFSGFRLSLIVYVYLALAGAIIYCVFYLLRRIVLPLLKEEHLFLANPHILPLIEVIVYVIYVMTWLYYLILPHPLIGLVFVMVLIAASWGGISDVASGIWLKATDSLRVGEHIGLYGKKGTVIKMGLMGMHVEEAEGTILEYSYRSVLNAPIITKQSFGALERYAFDLEVAHMISAIEMQDIIEAIVFNLPWATISRKPGVELLKNQQGFRVILYSIDKRFFPHMEDLIRKRIKEIE